MTRSIEDDTRMANAFDLQEELQALQQTENYSIEREHDVRSMEPAEMDGLLQRASQRLKVTLLTFLCCHNRGRQCHRRIRRSRHISGYV
jgi:hypothetical protein